MKSALTSLLAFLVTLVVLIHLVKSSTIVDNPGALRVVGSLSPLHDNLLGYQPSLSALLVSRRPLLFGPPRLYLAAAHLVPHPVVTTQQPVTTEPYGDSTPRIPFQETTASPVTTSTLSSRAPEILNSNRASVPQVLNGQPPLPIKTSSIIPQPFAPRRRIIAQSPAASEANFPSSQTQTGVDESRNTEPENDKDSAVEQIAAYSKPVAIPASGRALFSTINVADGSYHFGYDTGSGQHQSYREERRFPGGRVEGRYGYVDPEGVLRIVEYTADQRGYRSRLTTRNLKMTKIPIIGPIPAPLIAKARSNASSR